MIKEELKAILDDHKKWRYRSTIGKRADLSGANLSGANLSGADLSRADLSGANLSGANLSGADLSRADLSGADLSRADLSRADLYEANLSGANLSRADLSGADLYEANLSGANLSRADLSGANLSGAYLSGATGFVKIIGVEVGNIYWKRIGDGFRNNDYQYRIGMNRLRAGETFESDERVMCSYPGLYFSSRSWATAHYGDRPYEARIRIPEGAQINEPWATDGKASADMIEIVQVFRDGVDVTEELRVKYWEGK